MYLKLSLPNKKYLSGVKDAISEYCQAPSKFEINAVKKMISAQQNNFSDYFTLTENERLGINLKPNYVSHTVFWLICDDEYVGTFDLRHSITPYLKQTGGHIAYQIRPSKQQKGFAYNGLQLCLKEAFKMGLNKVLLTCIEENIASYTLLKKAIRTFGGIEDFPSQKDGIINKRVWLWTSKKPTIYLICGFLGAGKTTYSQKLANSTNSIHLNPDEWCMKLFSKNEYETNWDECFKYSVNYLWQKANEYALQNKNVIFDMGFWNKKDRLAAYKKAFDMGFQPVFCYVYAPDDVMIKRLSQRKGLIAENNIKNFKNLKNLFEEPDDDEFYIFTDNSKDINI